MVLPLSALLKVRPTKIELIRLRRRLATSVRVKKILSERLTILVNEFMVSLRAALEKRYLVQKQLSEVYRRAEIMLGIYGSTLPKYLGETSLKPKIYAGTENIMGVKIKTLIVKYGEAAVSAPPGLRDFVQMSRDFLNTLLELSKLEHALYELGREISSTKRKSNALQYIVIPRLQETIKRLQLKFDEREREEKARLKRIKQILSRRVPHG